MDKEELLTELRNEIEDGDASLFDVIRAVRRKISHVDEQNQAVFYREIMETITPMEILPKLEDRFMDMARTIAADNPDTLTIAKKTINGLIKQNPPEEEFYHKLLIRLHDSVLLDTEEKQNAFFLAVWIDVRIPYYQINADFQMTSSEFFDIIRRNAPLINRIGFVINRGGISNPHQAALLMDLINSVPDKREKAALWSAAFSIAAKKASLGRNGS